MTSPEVAASAGPGVLDALSLVSQVADDLVLKTVRDTHVAILDRVEVLTGTRSRLHRGIAGAVYGGLGLGLRGASAGLDRAAATGVGPRLEDGPRGRFLNSAVNGLIGDTLLRERPQLAIPIAVRRAGADVAPTREALAEAFGSASGQVAVFLHGLCENEDYWRLGRERTGASYPELVEQLGWTPLVLRANTGLTLRENGVELTGLMQQIVEHWPVPVTRIALIGHSMGGLIMRAACAVEVPAAAENPHQPRWQGYLTDLVTLGTPHRGAPIAWGIGHGSRGLGVLAETAAFGRILDWRSRGVHDLVVGLGEDVPPLPAVRYRLVAATFTASARHPVGHVVGDVLVRPASAFGRDRAGRELFPGAEVLHVGGTGHFGLLNHPDVAAGLRRWLGPAKN
jgi:pimeloyl-ACP methyl ester carboxylesterase